jgi:flagellar hook-associated protein 1 FlgK
MPAGLGLALNSAVQSLQVNQTGINLISNNIANAGTTGYSRQIVTQQINTSGGAVSGVGVAEVRRSVDKFLTAQSQAQISNVGYSTAVHEVHQRLQQFVFGEPGSQFTLNASLDRFFSDFGRLSTNTSSSIASSSAVSSAINLASNISRTATDIYNELYSIEQNIGDTITAINTSLANLNDLNSSIKQNSIAGGDVLQLLDARDLEIRDLKELIDADISYDSYGQVFVSLSNTELLGQTTLYKLDYTKASSVTTFINGGNLNGINVVALDSDGNETDNSVNIFSASNATTSVDQIPTGKLKGLLYLRDTELPRMLDQLDQFAYQLSDRINSAHNSGSGFPPARTLTGTESFTLSDTRNFSGNVSIAAVSTDGTPITGRYGYQLPPLTINFDTLNGGGGAGTASIQDIINEINEYYSIMPSNIANIGPATDIRMASVSSSVNTTQATGTITFAGQPSDLDTIDINGVTYTFVTGTPATSTEVKIGTSTGVTISNLAAALNISINPLVSVATYAAGASTLSVTFDTGGTDGNAFTLAESATNVTVSGANLTGGAAATGNFELDFDFSNLDTEGGALSFDVLGVTLVGAAGAAGYGGTFDAVTQAAGARARTGRENASNDTVTIDLTGSSLNGGDNFTAQVQVQVTAADGTVYTDTISYQITIPVNSNEDITNQRYYATAVSGSGDAELVSPSLSQGIISATFVDAEGNEITDTDTPGFLKLTTSSSDFRISIDDSTSSDNGDSGAVDPTDTATSRGFSHFFGLNNLFTYGGEVENAAYNIGVRSDIQTSPSLLSKGRIVQSVQLGTDSIYTFEIGASSNQTILDILNFQTNAVAFDEAGTLPELDATLNEYVSEIVNYAANKADRAESELEKQSLLQDALDKRIDDVSGVNVDEELANTVQYQNNYAASARLISMIKDLFTELNDIIKG